MGLCALREKQLVSGSRVSKLAKRDWRLVLKGCLVEGLSLGFRVLG